MHKKVGAFTKLFVAIAAAMAVGSVCAGTAAGAPAPDTAHPAQDQAPTATQAAQKDAAAADAKRRTEATQLGAVVVSANRREETLQSIAAPVSVLTNMDLGRQHMEGFADYAGTIPGLNYVSSGPGLTALSIRGISSGSAQPSASVGTYVDETPYGSSSVFAAGSLLTPDLDPADLERVEVLRGPQGTLYGAGALGGVLRFITIAPDTHAASGRIQIDGNTISGGGDGFGMRAMVNLPLIEDKLAIRVNVYGRNDAGYVDDAALNLKDLNSSKVQGGRFSLLWTPTEKTSLRLTALAQNLNLAGSPTISLDPATNKPLYGDLQQRAAAGTGTFVGQYRLYNGTLKSDLGWSTLTVSSSYSTLGSANQVDDTSLLYLGPPTGTFQTNTVRQTKATQEVRLQSPTGQTVEWLGGVFYTHETGSNLQHIYPGIYNTGQEIASPFGMPIGDVSLPSKYDAYAVYGSATWHATDKFDIEAGLRYSHDKQDFKEYGSGVLFGSAATLLLVDKTSADSSTTYSLTPSFHFNETTQLYGRIASGFLPGGPNVVPLGIAGVPATFSPTKLVNYELGLKSTSFNDSLLVDVSAFYIDWTKIPLITFINPYSFLTDAGKAKSQGLEATVQYIPVKGLRLAFNSAYTDPTLTADAPTPSNGRKGDRLPYTPKFTASLSADYDFPLRGNWNGFVGGTYQYLGSRVTDFTFDGTARATLPSYDTVSLRAGVSQDAWTISAYVKNLTNERGIVQGGDAGRVNPITGLNQGSAVFITPRMYGITVSRDF